MKSSKTAIHKDLDPQNLALYSMTVDPASVYLLVCTVGCQNKSWYDMLTCV